MKNMIRSHILFFVTLLTYISLSENLTWDFIPLITIGIVSTIIYSQMELSQRGKDLIIFSGHMSFVYLTIDIGLDIIYSFCPVIFYFGFWKTIIMLIILPILIFTSAFLNILINVFSLVSMTFSEILSPVLKESNLENISNCLKIWAESYSRFNNNMIHYGKLMPRNIYYYFGYVISECMNVNDDLKNNKYSESGIELYHLTKATIKELIYKHIVQKVIAMAMQKMLGDSLKMPMNMNTNQNNSNASLNRANNYKKTLLLNEIDIMEPTNPTKPTESIKSNLNLNFDEIDELDELDELDDFGVTNDTNDTVDISDINDTTDANADNTENCEGESREELRKRLRKNIISKRNNRTGTTNRNIRNQLSSASEQNPEFANRMKEMMQSDDIDKILNSAAASKGTDATTMKKMIQKMMK